MASTSSAVSHEISGAEFHSRSALHDHGSVEAAGDPKAVNSSTFEIPKDPGDYLDHGLRRGLKGRHFVLIALGSIIGPGKCFDPVVPLHADDMAQVPSMDWDMHCTSLVLLASSSALVLLCVGEVTTMFPVHGGFIEHANRFVDPALSFSLSWLYYLMWSIYLASDWNAAYIILQYWVPADKMPQWAWYLIMWAVFNVLTTLGVTVYGELEYIFGMFKFLSLIVLFFISILANVGAFGGGYVGFRYWTPPTGPLVDGINGFGQVFVLAATYYVGTEVISLAAGESKNPQRDVPALAGWKSAGNFVNAIIIIAGISANNGVVYVQSRTLYTMALTGKAPAFFKATTSRGVPWRAILFSNLWGWLALMNMSVKAGAVFTYFNSVGGTAAYFTWIIIMLTFLRVRAGLAAQGVDLKTLPFKAAGSIWIYRLTFLFFIFLLFIQGWTVFKHPFNWKSFIASYITIPTFFTLYFGYKWYHDTRWLRASEIPLADRNVRDESVEEAKHGVPWRRKAWRLFKD
ncbi:hypothetical protein LTR10_022716 [Elasticomyces elasticus]|uniref:Amino acid permease/ SLC12A domain-containing protein n=1 Tax=Exophiala sideris TaxID=1016849 RepID=A0ABR0IW53_9EURO|nr:hypothetical protein LTR10_022716 [Elasticomyces elasticus]KAK5021496.1 hypothetical protein LTS07_011005 [Exophiala sideris]KAK5024481.1 hypothetical protein LTR13_010841 [Exophiala sideris]KAK5049628.1 hypothetical protein LTR69_011029 [Exophiala sideris]KAK5176577.1 hypothetical protein LTR44_010862 [Eurotiomycetes sp. CCFEE 6388]